jgi:small subunit ribosomal protein S6e
MTSFKIVIGNKKGKCLQKELTEEESAEFIGKKIGETVLGDKIGFAGYEFLITGGSDFCGFPMRFDIDGSSRKKIFAVQGIGLKKKGRGTKIRKTVCGNTIYAKTAQINLKVQKEGKDPLFEEVKPEVKESSEETKEKKE